MTDEPWRIGRHYGIHVYAGERPVATFHDPADAQRAVDAVNGVERTSDELREAIAEVLLACLRDGNPLYYEDAADECADALLPVVTARAERRGRERAAEEARKTAEAWQWKAWFDMPLLITERIGAAQYVTNWLRARVDALTAELEER